MSWKDKWIWMAVAGGVILVAAMPMGQSSLPGTIPVQVGEEEVAEVAAQVESTYEEQLEKRVKEILRTVDGVGKVDVMIVLKASEEKVYHVDQNKSVSTTKETDSSGGSRDITSRESEETTILMDGSSGSIPVLEKEVKPEIEGIIISAAGGGSPKVKAEISEAMEALFGIPSHKIKVLKRVE
ncbi:MAG: stage III sporulation protein AG [Lachnospiraceae bacterium]